MEDNNRTALYILLALGVILGWLMGLAEDAMDHEENCQQYWEMVKLYIDTDGEKGWPPYESTCLAKDGEIK